MDKRRMSTNSNNVSMELSTPKKCKQETSDDSSSSPTVSRYGRSHKPKIQDDFVSTDKKVSAYLKISPGNRIQNFSAHKEYKKKSSPKKANLDSDGTPKRGRPSKVPVKSSPDGTEDLKSVKLEPQDLNAVVDGCEWMVGDLAWARVGGHPFWPCIIALDPVQKIFTKTMNKGRSSVSQRWIHVQFFGDNGRRSWLNITSIMSFNGRDAFVQLGETILAGMRKKEPKQTAAFVIKPAVVQVWEKAVQEAEDLINASREERVAFFTLHFPPPKPILTKELVMAQLDSTSSPPQASPKKRGRKRKTIGTPTGEELQNKQVKTDVGEPAEVKVEKSEQVDPLSTTPRTIADRKKRQALLMQLARSSNASLGDSPSPATPASSPATSTPTVETPATPKQAPLKSSLKDETESVDAYLNVFIEQAQHDNSKKKSLDEKFQELVKDIFSDSDFY